MEFTITTLSIKNRMQFLFLNDESNTPSIRMCGNLYINLLPFTSTLPYACKTCTIILYLNTYSNFFSLSNTSPACLYKRTCFKITVSFTVHPEIFVYNLILLMVQRAKFTCQCV